MDSLFNVFETETPPRLAEAFAERALMTAMAMNPLVWIDRSQLVSAGARVAARALVQPRVLAGVTADVARELVAIARGRSARAPESGDRRWTDPAFRDQPFYRRLMQAYLAWRAGIQRLIDGVALDAKSRERGRFALSLLTEALAPTNSLLGNPAALRRTVESRGKNLVSGARRFIADLEENGGLPSQVDRRPFRVGHNLATTPGQVVFSSEVLELIQYRPSTPRVRERPILLIPPQINKFYLLDLAPGRSLVEFLVARGFQVFAVSWRNPTPAERDWDLDRYVQALKDATAAVLAIAGADQLGVASACAGGVTTSVLLGHLAALGDPRVASATFMVTGIDSSVPSSVGMLVTEKTVAASLRRSQRRGILSGVELGRAFAFLRPNDLIWNYWVNNYLLGDDPPAFDILYWNNDATNLPAALHADFLALYLENSLCTPGRLEVLGTPIDLGRVAADVYAVGALADHIIPWDACYRTPRLFGGPKVFVASSSGHIQALVNPPPASKARYYTNGDLVPDAQAWLAAATERKGTWWTHWVEWLGERSGGERDAPATLGGPAHPPLRSAPGLYVHQAAR